MIKRDSNNLSNNTGIFLAAFLLLYLISVLVNLGYFPLSGEEPRRAIVSIEMLESGNFISPTTLGWEYYNKPPVYNWIMSLFMWIAGSTSEIPVRLPSLFFLLVWAFCNYHILKKFVPQSVAALSSLFVLTSFDIFFYGLGNGGEIDVFYSFIVYLQVISLFYFNQQKKWGSMFLASYLFCAIGFLTKGYPSIVFQVLSLFALGSFNRSARFLFKPQHLAGIGLFVLICGGYLYVYSFYNSPGRLLANLLRESIIKSALGEYNPNIWQKLLNYPLSFFKLLLPWSLLLLLLLKKQRTRLWSIPIIRFSILFILFNIPVYWITGQPKMRYIYMFLPFCMLIFATIFYHFKIEYPSLTRKILRWSATFFLLVLLIVGGMATSYNLNTMWFVFSVVLLVVYLVYYRKLAGLWYFALGIVLMRLMYALVFIPVQYEQTEIKYDEQMQAMALANDYGPVSIYKQPERLNLEIDLRVHKFNFGSVAAVPYLSYQMPYYYYRSTGNLVRFDTVLAPNRNYIGYRSGLKDLQPAVIYSFIDRHQHYDEIVLFRIPDPGPISGNSPVKRFTKHILK